MGDHYKFTASDPTKAEMAEILKNRVRRVYGMNLLQYARARRRGRLPDVPGRAALEVFAGDFGRASGRATIGL